MCVNVYMIMSMYFLPDLFIVNRFNKHKPFAHCNLKCVYMESLLLVILFLVLVMRGIASIV